MAGAANDVSRAELIARRQELSTRLKAYPYADECLDCAQLENAAGIDTGMFRVHS